MTTPGDIREGERLEVMRAALEEILAGARAQVAAGGLPLPFRSMVDLALTHARTAIMQNPENASAFLYQLYLIVRRRRVQLGWVVGPIDE